MPFVHGKNSIITMEDSLSASYGLKADMTSIVLNFTRDNPVVTTMGNDTQQRISGIRDVTLNGAYIWNGDTVSASAAPQLLDSLMTASNVSVVRFAPAGSITGCPLYTACMLINSHQVNSPQGGAVVGTFTMEIATGSLTTGCCV